MTPGTAVKRKKPFWRNFYAATGLTFVTSLGFLVWAGRSTEQKLIRPYICTIADSVVSVQSIRLHQPIECRLNNLENDTKVIRFIIEAGTDPAVIRAAVAKAKDSTFRVR